MIEYIYASKIFQSSSNQERILANLSNPINKELIVQLEEYLDDETREKYLGDNASDAPSVFSKGKNDGGESEGTDNESVGTTPSRSSSPSRGGSFTPSKSELMDDLENQEFTEIEPTETTSEAPSETPSEPTVESATKVKFREINSATVLHDTRLDREHVENEKPSDSISYEVLQGTLDLSEDTEGVARIYIKETDNDSELWIYYSDDVNLNSKLFNVVQLVEQAYPFVSFNRMARSDNAVVFDIIKE